MAQQGLFTAGTSIEELLAKRNTRSNALQQSLMANAAQGAARPMEAQAYSLLGSSLGRALAGNMGGKDKEMEALKAKNAGQKALQGRYSNALTSGTPEQQMQLAGELIKLGLPEGGQLLQIAQQRLKGKADSERAVQIQATLNNKGKQLAAKLGSEHPFYDQLMGDTVQQGLLNTANTQLANAYNKGVEQQEKASTAESAQKTLNNAGAVLASTVSKDSPYYQGLTSKLVTSAMITGATKERDATYERKIVSGDVTAEQQIVDTQLKQDAKSLALTLGAEKYPDTYATLMHNPTKEAYTKALAMMDADKKVSKTQAVPTAASTARQSYEYVQKNPQVKEVANVNTLATRALNLMKSNDSKSTSQLFKTISLMYNQNLMAASEIDRLTNEGTIPESITNALRSGTIGGLDRETLMQLKGVVETAQTSANETLGTIVVQEFNSRLPSFADDPTLLEKQLLTFFPAASIIKRIDPAARGEHPEGTILDGKIGGPQEGKRFMVIAGHIVKL